MKKTWLTNFYPHFFWICFQLLLCFFSLILFNILNLIFFLHSYEYFVFSLSKRIVLIILYVWFFLRFIFSHPMEFGLEVQNVQSYIHINRSKTTTHGSKVGVFLYQFIFFNQFSYGIYIYYIFTLLRRHSQVKHMISCKTCGKEFKTKWSLATHVSRYHR